MRNALLALVVAVPAFLVGCTAPPDAGDEFYTMLDDFHAYLMAENPIRAGLDGDRDALTRLPGVTPADVERRRRALEIFRARATAMDADLLREPDRTHLAVLRHVIDQYLGEIQFDSARIVFNSEGGPEQILGTIQRAAAIRTRADADAYLRRLEAAAVYIRDQTENARRGIRTGFVQPRSVTEHTLRQLAQQAELAPELDVAFRPLLALPDSIPEEIQAQVRDEARRILQSEVRVAQREFVAMLRDEYLPVARDSLGASELPEGREYYRFLVRKFTTTDLTPDQIHALGVASVQAIRAEMDKEIAATGWDGDHAGFVRFLRTDPRFYAKSREDLVMRASTIAKEIDGRIPAFFRTPPRLPYNVTEVPREIEDNYTTARYNLGSLEAGIPGSFVVNTSHLHQRPLYDLPDLALHEGVPGHHLQIAIRQEADIPWFRRNFQFDAYTEGWAHYAEWLGLEMGIYKTPYERFGLWSAYMWRACRLVADTGLHWLGWSLEQARECFYENSALAPHNIETELQRYIAWPGQALSYKVGELKFRELRASAERALGPAFDLRAFHDMLLWGGDLPLDLLEERTVRWIEERLRE